MVQLRLLHWGQSALGPAGLAVPSGLEDGPPAPPDLHVHIRVPLTDEGDFFEDFIVWDIQNVALKDPEAFAVSLGNDLGLSLDVVEDVARSVNEQLKRFAEDNPTLLQVVYLPHEAQAEAEAAQRAAEAQAAARQQQQLELETARARLAAYYASEQEAAERRQRQREIWYPSPQQTAAAAVSASNEPWISEGALLHDMSVSAAPDHGYGYGYQVIGHHRQQQQQQQFQQQQQQQEQSQHGRKRKGGPEGSLDSGGSGSRKHAASASSRDADPTIDSLLDETPPELAAVLHELSLEAERVMRLMRINFQMVQGQSCHECKHHVDNTLLYCPREVNSHGLCPAHFERHHGLTHQQALALGQQALNSEGELGLPVSPPDLPTCLVCSLRCLCRPCRRSYMRRVLEVVRRSVSVQAGLAADTDRDTLLSLPPPASLSVPHSVLQEEIRRGFLGTSDGSAGGRPAPGAGVGRPRSLPKSQSHDANMMALPPEIYGVPPLFLESISPNTVMLALTYNRKTKATKRGTASAVVVPREEMELVPVQFAPFDANAPPPPPIILDAASGGFGIDLFDQLDQGPDLAMPLISQPQQAGETAAGGLVCVGTEDGHLVQRGADDDQCAIEEAQEHKNHDGAYEDGIQVKGRAVREGRGSESVVRRATTRKEEDDTGDLHASSGKGRGRPKATQKPHVKEEAPSKKKAASRTPAGTPPTVTVAETPSHVNLEVCVTCQKERDEQLVNCQRCPRAYHAKCARIKQLEEIDTDAWLCEFCRDPEDEVEISVIADTGEGYRNPEKDCRRVLDLLMQHDLSGAFCEPIDLEAAPGYLELVGDPIDLGEIMNTFFAAPVGGRKEKARFPVGDFALAVRRVWLNCRTYNQEGSVLYTIGELLSRIFEANLRQRLDRHMTDDEREELERQTRHMEKEAAKSLASLGIKSAPVKTKTGRQASKPVASASSNTSSRKQANPRSHKKPPVGVKGLGPGRGGGGPSSNSNKQVDGGEGEAEKEEKDDHEGLQEEVQTADDVEDAKEHKEGEEGGQDEETKQQQPAAMAMKKKSKVQRPPREKGGRFARRDEEAGDVESRRSVVQHAGHSTPVNDSGEHEESTEEKLDDERHRHTGDDEETESEDDAVVVRTKGRTKDRNRLSEAKDAASESEDNMQEDGEVEVSGGPRKRRPSLKAAEAAEVQPQKRLKPLLDTARAASPAAKPKGGKKGGR